MGEAIRMLSLAEYQNGRSLHNRRDDNFSLKPGVTTETVAFHGLHFELYPPTPCMRSGFVLTY
jgi:hypothetical protein